MSAEINITASYLDSDHYELVVESAHVSSVKTYQVTTQWYQEKFKDFARDAQSCDEQSEYIPEGDGVTLIE